MSKTFDFKEQLEVGNAGEELFLKFYTDIRRLDGRKGDFIGKSGRKIELKTDSRTTGETKNFFIEQYRDEQLNPGGPFQSLQHEVYYFTYMFADGIIYWFETAALVAHIEKHAEKYQQRTIQNKGWSAMGYLVPRASLEDLIIKKERINE